MAWEVSYVLVVVKAQVTDRVVDFGAAVYRGVLRVGEVDQIYTVLLGIDGTHLGALLAVVYDYLVVLRAGNQCVPVRREIDAIYSIGILAEYLGHLEAPHHVVNELHGDGRRDLPFVPSS